MKMQNKKDKIGILYEDENILVVNKPTGLVVHSDGKTKEYVLTDWITENYPEIKDVGEKAEYNGKEILRPGIVHRLDRDTSGVIVVAKTQDAYIHLKEQFKGRRVDKIYQAFVYGKIKEAEGVVDRPIGRSGKDFRQWSAQRGARGVLREATTNYEVEKTNEIFSYIKLIPKTGRTHQLRVHMKAINHPIVCDKLYAPKRECLLGFERLALHALSIDIELQDGSRKTIEAPLPPDFEKALAGLQNL